jgi:hypothetical protein
MNKSHSACYCMLVLISLSYSSCSPGKTDNGTEKISDTTEIVHFNITIAPDLSNRLDESIYPRPMSDDDIANIVIKNFYPAIVNHKRIDLQRDQLSVGFINKKIINEIILSPSRLRIDLAQFKNQLDRIKYIKGRSKETLTRDTSNFMSEFRKMISLSQTHIHGADIWSYFNDGLDDVTVVTKEKIEMYNNKIYRNSYRNILLLLTDGYIEAGIYKRDGCPDNSKKCYYLSKSRISEIRTQFKKSGTTNLKEYFEQSGYGILPAQNKNLKNLEVLVLELYDRSLTKDGTPTIYPTDMEILSLFWNKWLKDSQVKRFEIRPVFSSKEGAEKAILNFILHD